jgi:rubrerythrin
MGTKFLSDNEMLTVAMNMEDEGYRFYDTIAKQTKRKETKEIFQKLRDDETEHYKTFKEMLDSLPGADSKDYFGIKEETASYLRVLVETGVFKNVDKESLRRIDETKTLEMAIQAERDAVLFYTEAQKSSVNPKAKKIMSEIIDIEKGHIVVLTSRLRIARKLF